MDADKKLIKIGSRKSELALIQTNCVIDMLRELYPGKSFSIEGMSTLGDEVLDRALPQIGEKSLFTATLEKALSDGKVDALVHSLKDMPTSLPEGLVIAAITAREDPRDAVIVHSKHRGLTLAELPHGSIIGTSSLRRKAQLARRNPHLTVMSIRGNLQTRLAKLDSGLFDAIVLAVAGVNRLGWEHRISQILEPDEMMYAVGQGSLAIECRAEDAATYWRLGDPASTLRCLAERSLLYSLSAGCSAPVAVVTDLQYNSIQDDRGDHNDLGDLSISAVVLSLDGQNALEKAASVSIIPTNQEDQRQFCGVIGGIVVGASAAHKLGADLAKTLISLGASEIIAKAKQDNDITK